MRTSLFIVLLLLPSALVAQQVAGTHLVLDGNSPKLHLTKRTDPVYPAIAKAAQIAGQVKLQIEIGSDGHVIASKSISGPPMLVGAAQDCVKQWVYEPVKVDGNPTNVSTIVTVPFGSPAPSNVKNDQIAAQFFPVFNACVKSVSMNVSSGEQAETCRKAAEIAENFSADERFIERRSSFVHASTALRRNKQMQDALKYANKAVSVVEQGHDDGSGSSAAYGVRAQAEAQLGDLAKASEDLNKAEEFERSAIDKMGGSNDPFAKREHIPVFKGMLGFHAQVLTALGKQEEAAAKAAEAESFDPKLSPL